MIADILRQARVALSNEKDWRKGSQSFEGNGCAEIAIHVASPSQEANHAVLVLSAAVGFASIPFWNDTRTHKQMLAGFDKAIELADKRENPRRKTDISALEQLLRVKEVA